MKSPASLVARRFVHELLALAEEKFQLEDRIVASGTVLYGTAIAAMLLVLEVFAVTDVEIPFVYFQF